MRIDKFLKVSQLIKRRTVAKEACEGGRVKINGRPAKSASEVAVGDTIHLSLGRRRLEVEVVEIPQGVVSKERASELYRTLVDEFQDEGGAAPPCPPRFA